MRALLGSSVSPPSARGLNSHGGVQKLLNATAHCLNCRRQRNTMLYLVGLGLADETDITVRGLEVVKKAERVYLEAYTSILLVDKAKLVRTRATRSICVHCVYFSVS